MATLPTPQELAQEILDIFVSHFKARTDDVLRVNNFLDIWPKRGHTSEDFSSGLEYAIKEGWLELLPGGSSYRLTESGFTAA